MAKIKTLDELKKIRDGLKKDIEIRENSDADKTVKIIVGMATCGIAAGARPVMKAFMEEIDKRSLQNITVSMTGCIGVCRLEPVVEIIDKDGNKVTYVKMTAEKAARVVVEHLVNGNVCMDLTIGAEEVKR